MSDRYVRSRRAAEMMIEVVLQVHPLKNQDRGGPVSDRLPTGLIHTEPFPPPPKGCRTNASYPAKSHRVPHIHPSTDSGKPFESFRTRTRQDRRPASAWHFDAKAKKTRYRKGALVEDNYLLSSMFVCSYENGSRGCCCVFRSFWKGLRTSRYCVWGFSEKNKQ